MKRLVIGFGIILMSLSSLATEGMWIPALLKAVEGDMQSMGLRLSAEDIYSINQSSLKDAVVHFGGGCTAEVISEEGLILTNHHCGYGQIQSHSAEGKNYLKDGFWAMTRKEELKNPGLTATFIVRLEDVTKKVNAGTESLNDVDVKRKQLENIKAIETAAVNGTAYKATVKPFYYGNEFYMIVTKTYDDVRLVGAPPSAIGKFGGDTDNWVWPRHTGDFSLFRIYANKNNEPAAISDENVAYNPAHSFPVSIAGLKEGDFTMIYGFPGTTQQYLTSGALDYVISKSNPTKIKMREASLSIIDAAMKSTEKLYIQYAAKQSRISNAYKKWIGQQIGLKENAAVAKKIKFEKSFQEKVKNDNEYKNLLSEFSELYKEKNEFTFAREMWIELYYYGPEILRYSAGFSDFQDYDLLAKSGEMDELKKSKLTGSEGFFKNYDINTDKKIFVRLLKLYRELMADNMEATLPLLDVKYKGDYEKYADYVYEKSAFVNKTKTQNFINSYGKSSAKKLNKDPGYNAAIAVLDAYRNKCVAQFRALNQKENELMKKYLAARMKYFPERKYAADANSTLRLTYGKIEGSSPRDGMSYTPFSTIDGIIQKNNLGKDDFEVPARLKELHAKKDYGQYGQDGTLNVCFTGSNHTTGGNSGSPVLDANGYLIGLNFDRTWESTMSDYNFDTTRCRNIAVDIRYVLWVIDKYAGAGHLVKEMNLITTRDTDSEFKQREIKKKIKQLTAQIRDFPQNPELFLERGKEYSALGLKKEALNDFLLAANLPNKSIESLNLNAKLLLENGDLEEAFEVIEKSQRINDRTNVGAAVTKARIREAMGQTKLARKGYERAFKLGQGRDVDRISKTDTYFYLGQFERKQGNISESNRLLGLAAKLGGGSYIDYYRKVVQGK